MRRAALFPSLSAIKRRTPWVFALALLLQAAVPLLASAAAQIQGKTLVEVCTVYGVATVTIDDGSTLSSDAPGHAGAAADAACALGGLLLGGALALPELDATGDARSSPASAGGAVHRAPHRDACAAWFMRLQHAPPPSA